VEAKPFSWAKLAYFGFSSSNFTVQDRIQSTAGAARTCSKNARSCWVESWEVHGVPILCTRASQVL
jgi:hypothetical protein